MKRGSVWALLLCIILATVSVMPHTAWAQPRTLAQWQSTLTSSWLMTVQAERVNDFAARGGTNLVCGVG